MSRQAHWDRIYTTRAAEELSWFQAHPALSLELIERAGVALDAALIDIGGGDSLLVDKLLDLGYRNLTVLDVSAAALERARLRLGERAESVRWVAADVTRYEPESRYDLWHDRAVFHFLTEAADRSRYIGVLRRALRPGGQAVLSTFSLDGPSKCSGLEVRRYSAESLARELGSSFELVEHREQEHHTPSGAAQAFVYGRFLKTG